MLIPFALLDFRSFTDAKDFVAGATNLRSYIWPFEGNHWADVALGENEFDTPDLETEVRVAKLMNRDPS